MVDVPSKSSDQDYPRKPSPWTLPWPRPRPRRARALRPRWPPRVERRRLWIPAASVEVVQRVQLLGIRGSTPRVLWWIYRCTVMAMAMSYKWLFHLGLKGMIHPKQNGFISVLLTGISGHKCGKDVPIEPARTWKHEGPLLIFMATWV